MALNLADKLQNYLSNSVFQLLQQAGELAAQHQMGLYLIGGSVRELLLSHPENIDVDLVVEGGHSRDFAYLLQQRFGGSVTLYEEFGTAKLKLERLPVIDIATARTEVYATPGAPPKVCFSTLRADLQRRDFSINALALSLMPDDFGNVIDFFNGLRDLQRKRLRILHPEKFIEDPVRIWRACRFELRLGFRLDRQSAALARQAMEKGYFYNFITPRIKQELKNILAQAAPLPVLERLDELGGLGCLDQELHMTPLVRVRLAGVAELNPLFGVREFLWLVHLCVLVQFLPRAKQTLIYQQLNLARKKAKIINDLHSLEKQLLVAQILTPSNAELFFLFERRAPESLLAFLCTTNDALLRQLVLKYWTELRHTRLAISGKILKGWGVPGVEIGQVLRALLIAKLNGQLPGPEAETQLARQMTGK